MIPPCPLQPLFQAAAALVPGMVGEIGGAAAGYITPGTDNRAALTALADGIRARHPQAGQGYWALRSWNMLEWQPVVLTLLGVHGLGMLPCLDTLGLRVRGPMVMGYRLPLHIPARGETPALIERGGRQLRIVAESLLEDLNGVIRVKPLLARRLLADRVLGVLLDLAARRPDLPDDLVEDYAQGWLSALNLEGQSALGTIGWKNGRRRLVLERRACCLAYRSQGGGYCDSCPVLPLKTRIERVQCH
ncbi:MAG: siderophore ferric iron reductase [Candidatus Competibacteraceae bacterium]|nr:siderophore ferric iron reductase [Candidatus Competibacteraceae bacterium]